MKIKLILITSIAVLLSSPSYSSVIDFQQLEQFTGGPFRVAVGTNKYLEDGFQIDYLGNRPNDGFYSLGTLDGRYTGSTAMFNNTPSGETRLSKEDGGTFDLISIELAKMDGDLFDNVTFTRDGGYSQTFVSDEISITETFLFDTGFLGSSSVTWTQAAGNTGFVQFDNINASPVPAPAAVWLFSLGLIGLFGLTRRKKSVVLFKAWFADRGYFPVKNNNAEEDSLKAHPSGLSQVISLFVRVFCGIKIPLQKPALMAKTWRCQKSRELFRAS